jgi:hypothetical protein
MQQYMPDSEKSEEGKKLASKVFKVYMHALRSLNINFSH